MASCTTCNKLVLWRSTLHLQLLHGGVHSNIEQPISASDFVEYISLKPLDSFSPVKVLWNCLDMKLCNIMVICPLAPYGHSHGPETSNLVPAGSWFCRVNISEVLDSVLHSKVFRIVLTCSCAMLWPLAHLTHMGLRMDKNTYLWKHWMDFLHSKFYGIVLICSCAASWSFAHLPHMGSPMVTNLTNMGFSIDWHVGGVWGLF